jgi:hypothetical protein
MAIALQNLAGTDVLEIDEAFKAARVSLRPCEVLSWNSIGVSSGLIASGMGVNALLFSFRNASANPVLVRRVGLGFMTTTAFTVAQTVEFGLVVARNFTAAATGGSPVSLTGSNGKHRTSLATPTSLDCRILSTAPANIGTRTLDANQISQQTGWSGGLGVTIPVGLDNLFQHTPGDYPLVLAQNEGFEIVNNLAFGAGGVGKLTVNFEFAEAASY